MTESFVKAGGSLMKRLTLVAVSLLALAGGIATALAPHGNHAPTAAGSHGLLAPFDDGQLTERAGVVVRGEVLSSEIVPLKDDPDLPSPITPLGQRMVDAGMAHVKWHVRVSEQLKGTAPEDIIVVQAHSGSVPGGGAALVELEDPAQDLFGALTHDEITPGQTYTFWLDKYDWFKKNYYVLARAKTIS